MAALQEIGGADLHRLLHGAGDKNTRQLQETDPRNLPAYRSIVLVQTYQGYWRRMYGNSITQLDMSMVKQYHASNPASDQNSDQNVEM